MSSHAQCTEGAPRIPHKLGDHQGPLHSAPPSDSQPAFPALSSWAWQTDRAGQVCQIRSPPPSPAARWPHGLARTHRRQPSEDDPGEQQRDSPRGRVGPLPVLVVTALPACSQARNARDRSGRSARREWRRVSRPAQWMLGDGGVARIQPANEEVAHVSFEIPTLVMPQLRGRHDRGIVTQTVHWKGVGCAV